VTPRDVLALRAERRPLLASPDAATGPLLQKVQQLLALRGIGEVSAWLYTTEFFGWRGFRNRRQVAGLAGLTPTTRSSGDLEREQGISKAGNVLSGRWRSSSPGAGSVANRRARCRAGTGRASPPVARGNAASALWQSPASS